jgi:hypothetical protein
MNFPSGENPGFVIVTDVAERVLSCMMRVGSGGHPYMSDGVTSMNFDA